MALRPINILIGANGSGKSNFIGVFAFLNAVLEGRLQDYVAKSGGANHVLYFGSKTTQVLSIRVSFKGEVNQYEIQLQPTSADKLVPLSEWVYFWGSDSYPEPYREPLHAADMEAGISNATQTSGVARFVRTHLARWRLYHFHDTGPTSPMKRMADLNDNRYLRPDASNLAAFLYFLKRRHPASYNVIGKTVRLVAPFFADFQLEPNRLNPDKIRLEWRHRGSEEFFDCSSLSDGTLRFMALATLFLQPSEYRPSVILVDEPELGLHPYAITVLASMIEQAAVETQVIASTQSSFLLDQFSPEDVMVAEQSDKGTQLTRLESEPLTEWLKDYGLGQLWEKNELGGRPNG